MNPLKGNFKFGYEFGEPTFYNSFHIGLDIIAPSGTPVYAPEDGVIKWTGTGSQGGKTIHLLSDSGLVHRFLHLSKIGVTRGQRVNTNNIIANVGNTGLSTAPHLHWDISKGSVQLSNKKNFIDPEQWMNIGKEFWPQANSAINAFTNKENNDPEATELARAWSNGDQSEVNRILRDAAANKIRS